MREYIGETITDISKTKYALYGEHKWVMHWISAWSGIDGAHHKDWVIDQIARIIHGTPIILKIAKWSDGTTEERFSLGDPPEGYWKWVNEMKNGVDGQETYGYDFGVAP